ncbi:MAG: endonuclease/exonuclease/phosphatase family protein [Verrucomicrobia bacterium]|nr:endonuclease/exonuclease/phosphatase family protein [Verrucomicrobiota bacterium]
MRLRSFSQASVALLFLCCLSIASGQDSVRIATYNVENYLDLAGGGRKAKPEESKAKIREMIQALNADVVALQEMGSTNALLELRASLKKSGVDYPHWEHITGYDTNIHVAVLSKYPFSARRSHTKDNFLLSGRRFQISRGFLEVDVQVKPDYSFTLLSAHLKSKRPVSYADQAEFRLEEAKLLREKVDARFAANPNANIIVLGDFNDTKDASSTRAVIGRGKTALIDTRPAEKNGDNIPAERSGYDPRNISWTHFYGKEDSYSRIDYILISPGMAREWIKEETYIPNIANWGLGSDHRPIVATFSATDK